MDINLSIKKRILTCTNVSSIVSGQVNSVVATFDFDDEWNELYKIITFHNMNDDKSVFIVLGIDTTSCIVPWEVLANSGELFIYAEGTESIEDLNIIVASKMPRPIEILQNNRVSDPSEPFKSTPSLYEQLVHKISEIQLGKIDVDVIQSVVKDYLDNNKITFYDAIEEIKVNGSPLDIIDKSVDITVPTKVSDLENDCDYVDASYLDVSITPIRNSVKDNLLKIEEMREAIDTSTDILSERISDNSNKINEIQELIDSGSIPSGGGNAESIIYINENYETISNVDDALDLLLSEVFYVAPTITSFSILPAATQYEKGTVISNLVFNWSINKEVASQSLTDCIINSSSRTARYTNPLSTDKTFRLTVSDGRNIASSVKTINFYNKKYWGGSTSDTYDSEFILSLSNSQLVGNKSGNISFDVSKTEYSFFCIPQSFGIPRFTINGFSGGFSLVQTLAFTNSSGHTEDYCIYKSSNVGLGSFTATVS